MSSKKNFSNEEKLARHQLIRTPSVGPITFKHLLATYGTALQALLHLPDLAAKGRRKTPLRVAKAEPIIKELRALKALNGMCLHLGEASYPNLLSHIDDAPPILYLRGHRHLLDAPSLGIVGARNASATSLRLTQAIATEMSEAGYVITSGMARGIDSMAHKASIKGGTIACIAGGLDIIYPKENAALYEEISKSGLLVTEIPLGISPQARHFPRRNRIISGLSLGVLVIEAAQKSGSLITAKCALEQNREVFSVPGSPADPRARGTNQLIKDGAVLVQSSVDILNEIKGLNDFSLHESEQGMPPFEALETDISISDQDRRNISALLSPSPISIDEIIRISGYPASLVLAIILELELANRAIRYPGNQVSSLAN
ncbi:DNA-processing protein DprA [Temperatibacter marinus]|uniref:DNA-processing protein DprA n=1 Tax=Temperatibacter marinus TaxID=1456591 RepID=A0AA52EG19_9PROT|nr:DNA-processing protein DprA [Temperatibacter marinus]WND02463.1 DNA-processing protein DprA [Temperatibacter marinus]